jgi:hypothetical protein
LTNELGRIWGVAAIGSFVVLFQRFADKTAANWQIYQNSRPGDRQFQLGAAEGEEKLL